MNKSTVKSLTLVLYIAFFCTTLGFTFKGEPIISHTVDLKTASLRFYSKDANGKYYKNHGTLLKVLKKKGKSLKFAMNGGMYKTDYSPLGLYIEDGIQKQKINKVKKAFGNFYMQPNGIFYIKNNKGFVCKTTQYPGNDSVQYATQSGPMLLINGKHHPAFNKGSKSLNIRNGVGILPNGNLLFAMSKVKINFYDFASFFKNKGCKEALYLDGFVSRTYLPSKNWKQLDGAFGVIIAEVK